MSSRISLSGLLVVLMATSALRGVSLQSPDSWTLAEPPFYKTSFDCAKAKVLSTEAAICKNEELAKLDLEAADAYEKRLEATPAAQRRKIIQSQRRWLSVRNSYEMDLYHGDPVGMLSDLADLYRVRISALRSSRMADLKTRIPEEYKWLKAIVPRGLNSNQFKIGRAFLGCEDPCRKRPSPYRIISVLGTGVGDEPGDIDAPFSHIERELAGQGWTECRSADDSGKPTINYFTKRDKMVKVFRYYSMGAGNSIELAVTTSGPLRDLSRNTRSKSAPIVPDGWLTYSSPDVGLRMRYPPGWRIVEDSAPGGTKHLAIGSKDFTGSFQIEFTPEKKVTHKALKGKSGEDLSTCVPSLYRISGFAARTCYSKDENVAEGLCSKYDALIDVETGKHHLIFEPGIQRDDLDRSSSYQFLTSWSRFLVP